MSMSLVFLPHPGEVVPRPEPARIAPAPLLEAGRCQLLLVDVQTSLVEAVPPAVRTRALGGLKLLATAAAALGVPVTVSEHMPDRLGPTAAELLESLHEAEVIPKTHFCAASEPRIAARVAALDRPHLVVAGMETHVCVLQAAVVFAAAGYDVHLAFDASAARHALDEELARTRADRAGVTAVSAEMVAFEWLRRGDHPARRTVIDAVKARTDAAGQS